MQNSLKLLSYCVKRKGEGFSRGAGVWGLLEPNTYSPLCYLRKPGWLTDDQFEAVVRGIRLEVAPDVLAAATSGGEG